MTPKLRHHLLLAGPIAISVWLVLHIVWIWIQRVSYPFDLEWIEGGVMGLAWRLQHAQSIYPEPSADFVGMVYPPGYPALAALAGSLFGLSLPLGRILSLLGTLAACAALVEGARRHLHAPIYGLIGAAVYLATYEASGAFLDLARPDAVSMGLLAWALILAPSPGRRASTAAGFLLFLATFVLQTAAVFILPVAAGIWAMRGPREALRMLVACLLPTLLCTLILQLATSGTFLSYVLSVRLSHPAETTRAFPGALMEMGKALPLVFSALALWLITLGPLLFGRVPTPVHVVMGVLAATGAALALPSAPGALKDDVSALAGLAFFGALACASLLGFVGQALVRARHGPWIYGMLIGWTALLSASFLRGHYGGFINVFMPAFWVVGAAISVLFSHAATHAPRERGVALVALVCMMQIGLIATQLQDERLVPQERARIAGEQLVEAVAQIDGPVLSPYAAWLPVLAGKPPSLHLFSLWDAGHKKGPFPKTSSLIENALREHHWAAILDAPDSMGFGVRKAYKPARNYPDAASYFVPKTGWRTHPSVLLTPHGALPDGFHAPSTPILDADPKAEPTR